MTDAERIVHYEEQLREVDKKINFINVRCPALDRLEDVKKALQTELAGLYQKVS